MQHHSKSKLSTRPTLLRKTKTLIAAHPKRLARRLLPKHGAKLAEEIYRRSRAYLLQAAEGFPAKDLRIIAVTGTNGKTTTCCYINELLKASGYRTALYSTAVIELDGKRELNLTHRTVPLTAELVSFFRAAGDARVDFVILEVTSMALHQHKLIGVPIEIGVMTNLTQDHLDYHVTMDGYAAAKARLFSAYCKPKYAVLNRDDPWFDYFKNRASGYVIPYGEAKGSDIAISDVQAKGGQLSWHVSAYGTHLQLTTRLLGHCNVQNATAAVSVGILLGLSPGRLRAGIAALQGVPGRMEAVDAGQPFTVLVDYAHTPDALQHVLLTARSIAKKRVRIVFGATGDRDKSKRLDMGRVAANLADFVYLTDDEIYGEDPASIRAAVRQGIEQAQGNYIEIGDRLEAMKRAFAEAGKGDVVVLAGIGHQNTRTMGQEQVAWDEHAIARQLLGG